MKLFLSDLDGTLMSKDHHVRKEDIEANKVWQAKGDLFGLVSGRGYAFCADLLREHGIKSDVLITNNGACAYIKDECVFSDPIEKQSVFTVFEDLKTMKEALIPFITMDDGYHYARKEELALLKQKQAHLKTFGEGDVLEEVKAGKKVYKISLYVFDPQMTDRLLALFQAKWPALNVSKTSIDYIEITNQGVDKRKAFDALEQNMAIDRERVAFIGDGSNDLPLFDALPHTYGMPHTPGEVKKHVNKIVTSIEEAIKIEEGRI